MFETDIYKSLGRPAPNKSPDSQVIHVQQDSQHGLCHTLKGCSKNVSITLPSCRRKRHTYFLISENTGRIWLDKIFSNRIQELLPMAKIKVSRKSGIGKRLWTESFRMMHSYNMKPSFASHPLSVELRITNIIQSWTFPFSTMRL